MKMKGPDHSHSVGHMQVDSGLRYRYYPQCSRFATVEEDNADNTSMTPLDRQLTGVPHVVIRLCDINEK